MWAAFVKCVASNTVLGSWQEKPHTHNSSPHGEAFCCIVEAVFVHKRCTHVSAPWKFRNHKQPAKTNRSSPPGKSAGECEGDPNRESMETLLGVKKKWHLDGFSLWNLFLAPSDDVGREVERWSFAAADTPRGTAPGIGRPQLWLWDWQPVQLEEHWSWGLDCSTGNGGRSSRDRACSGSHNKHISWSASITSSSCFSKCSSVPGHFLLASPNGDPAGKMPFLESTPLHTSTDFCFSFWFFMHGAEIGMLKLMSS